MSTKTTPSTSTAGTGTRATALRAWVLWTAGFLAFPIAGLAGIAAAGRVDGPFAALLGGVATGAVVGLGQALVSSRRLPTVRWTVATATGMGVGLMLGAHAAGYGTTMAQLALMGAVTGTALGLAQAVALPGRTRARWVWALVMPTLWAAGWAISTLVIGASVDNQFTLFGSSGAVTVSALLGVLLHLLLPTAPNPKVTTAVTAQNTTPTGDPS